MSPERLVHHELCFGCGRTNLFGLLMEVQRTDDGMVRGRGFIKQDHQGAVPGTAHPGVVAAALSEGMAFAAGDGMQLAALEVTLGAPAPVGAFLDVEASVRSGADGTVEATATAWSDGGPVARARGAYRAG